MLDEERGTGKMTVRCKAQQHQGYLNNPFIFDLAIRRLEITPEQLEELVGRYTRGQRKGQLRGKLTWAKVIKGGWHTDGPSYHDSPTGHVEYPGHTFDYKIVDAWDETKVLFEMARRDSIPVC